MDFILGDAEVAIEVKISKGIQAVNIHGLIAFQNEYQPKKAIVIYPIARPRKMTLASGQTIDIMPGKPSSKSSGKAKSCLKTHNQSL